MALNSNQRDELVEDLQVFSTGVFAYVLEILQEMVVLLQQMRADRAGRANDVAIDMDLARLQSRLLFMTTGFSRFDASDWIGFGACQLINEQRRMRRRDRSLGSRSRSRSAHRDQLID